MDRPLFPSDGVPYYVAMAEAIEAYELWVAGRRKTGIRVYSRKELDAEG